MATKKKHHVLMILLAAVVLSLPAFVEAAGEVNDSGGNWTVFDFGGGEVNDSGGNWTAFSVAGREVNDSGGNWTLLGLSVVAIQAANETPNATPGVVPSGAVAPVTGGGAGGGAGGTFASKAIEIIGEIAAGVPANVKNTNPNIKLDELQLILDEDAKDVNVQIEYVRDELGLSPPTGQFYAAGAPVVYQYLRINLGGQEGKIKEATLNFHVEKSWAQQYDIDVSSIRLAHYKDGEWKSLQTDRVSADSNNIYFKAKTTSFSLFAIVGKSNAFKFELPSLGELGLPEVGTYCGNFVCESSEDSKNCQVDCAREVPFFSKENAYNLAYIFVTINVVVLLLAFAISRRPPSHERVLQDYVAASQHAGYKPKSALEEYVQAALKAGYQTGKVEARLLQAGWNRSAVKDVIRRMNKITKQKK
jgi:PGF-pre-PGF domain-containing protein